METVVSAVRKRSYQGCDVDYHQWLVISTMEVEESFKFAWGDQPSYIDGRDAADGEIIFQRLQCVPILGCTESNGIAQHLFPRVITTHGANRIKDGLSNVARLLYGDDLQRDNRYTYVRNGSRRYTGGRCIVMTNVFVWRLPDHLKGLGIWRLPNQGLDAIMSHRVIYLGRTCGLLSLHRYKSTLVLWSR